MLHRRSIPPGTLIQDNMTVILDSGEALTSNHLSTDRSNYFHVLSPDGVFARSFGLVPEEESKDQEWPIDRKIAYSGGDSFWAGPIPRKGEAGYYDVEEWGTDGILRRTLRRPATWFVYDSQFPLGVQHFQAYNDAGLLYVVFQRYTSEGVRLMREAMEEGRPFPREKRYTETEVIVEMIDTRSAQLLASEVYRVSEAMRFIPEALFRGVMHGYVRKEAEDTGLPLIDIVAVELEAK